MKLKHPRHQHSPESPSRLVVSRVTCHAPTNRHFSCRLRKQQFQKKPKSKQGTESSVLSHSRKDSPAPFSPCNVRYLGPRLRPAARPSRFQQRPSRYGPITPHPIPAQARERSRQLSSRRRPTAPPGHHHHQHHHYQSRHRLRRRRRPRTWPARRRPTGSIRRRWDTRRKGWRRGGRLPS